MPHGTYTDWKRIESPSPKGTLTNTLLFYRPFSSSQNFFKVKQKFPLQKCTTLLKMFWSSAVQRSIKRLRNSSIWNQMINSKLFLISLSPPNSPLTLTARVVLSSKYLNVLLCSLCDHAVAAPDHIEHIPIFFLYGSPLLFITALIKCWI